ncbi:MAG: uncharacterized protein A8A55_0262 [Amphiamblys sp. WSBS2006]|nr:MAG: uncharacterized protein A8A55_0262 [Amphiamblys sp. WSBS2006]
MAISADGKINADGKIGMLFADRVAEIEREFAGLAGDTQTRLCAELVDGMEAAAVICEEIAREKMRLVGTLRILHADSSQTLTADFDKRNDLRLAAERGGLCVQ